MSSTSHTPYEFQTLRNADGAPDHGQNSIQLQATHEQSRYQQHLANGFWKGFQKYVPGRKTGAKGTNAMFVMKPEEVNHTPAARPAMYAKIAVNYQPQNNDPYQICITKGGNLINYPGESTRHTADIMT
jgi:hypothetical protein